MSQFTEFMLIDQLDGELYGGKPALVRETIALDPQMRVIWESLEMSVSMIREAGLNRQVAAVRTKFEQERKSLSAHSGAKLIHMNFRAALRVAVMLILVAGAGILYKYMSTNPENLYQSYYSSYSLTVSRGTHVHEEIESAYENHDWNAVVRIASAAQDKSNKSVFLSGMASMELKAYDAAIASFRLIQANNAHTGDNYFQDESEYYLAMAYLAKGQTSLALPILDHIRADNRHSYHKKACSISNLDLNILRNKSKH